MESNRSKLFIRAVVGCLFILLPIYWTLGRNDVVMWNVYYNSASRITIAVISLVAILSPKDNVLKAMLLGMIAAQIIPTIISTIVGLNCTTLKEYWRIINSYEASLVYVMYIATILASLIISIYEKRKN